MAQRFVASRQALPICRVIKLTMSINALIFAKITLIEQKLQSILQSGYPQSRRDLLAPSASADSANYPPFRPIPGQPASAVLMRIWLF